MKSITCFYVKTSRVMTTDLDRFVRINKVTATTEKNLEINF